MPGADDWSTLAASGDPDDIRERILTGFKTGKPFTPYAPTIALPGGLRRVLDFGCGLGRNFPYLTGIAERVVGFDLPAMIARCRALATTPVDGLDDDWTRVRQQRFDLVFASLVVQHVQTDMCRAYLHDFARLAPAVYLLTRTDSDFGQNVLDLVAETGAYDSGPCVEVEHDPRTHQLLAIGQSTLDEARRERASRHYEVLLRPRAITTTATI
ncbi:MAG TPA: class I SAM-dependent methyltransferase [Vicinamibacterales bacterium]|nr:class I SAM-dependent methyltransferase [Vicinamibacterales bacterium]